MSQYRVLIIDDDRLMRNSLVDLIEASGWVAKALSRATDAERWITQFQPDVILSDVRMPDMTGIELLQSLEMAPPIVLISAHGDIPTAVEAMNHGAYSFIEKPYDPKRLLLVLSHAGEQHQMRQSNARLKERLQQISGLDRVLLGQTPEMQRLRDTIAMVAGGDASVFIQGETGSGKDLVARAVHDLSARCDAPFVAVNAAQMTIENLPHIARSVAGGTLFLDEICASAPDLQTSLLRLVDHGEFLNAGEGVPERADIRIVAATNEDPNIAVNEGRFRQDLLFRLRGFELRLPSLRARPDDIALLMVRFLGEYSTLYETGVPELTQAEVAALIAHDWPGNVRELRQVAQRTVMMSKQGVGSVKEALDGASLDPARRPGLREAIAAFERQMISKAIKAHAGRMDDTAQALGIGRRTLNEKIVKLGLDKGSLL